MANFGFSVGDIILVSNYAYSVYKSCKHAGDEFKDITNDVNSHQSYLRILHEEYANPQSLIHRSTAEQREELRTLLSACHEDLRNLKGQLSKYKSLKTANPRTSNKLKFTAGKQADIRARIGKHSDRLQRILSGLQIGSLGRIESNGETNNAKLTEIRAKLDFLHWDVLAGKRTSSVITDMDDWIKEELIDDNITETDVEVNRDETAHMLEHISLKYDPMNILPGMSEHEGDSSGSDELVATRTLPDRPSNTQYTDEIVTDAGEDKFPATIRGSDTRRLGQLRKRRRIFTWGSFVGRLYSYQVSCF